jgi:hypothetical protein
VEFNLREMPMSEFKAMEAVDVALNPLTPEERARVLGWAHQKYGGPPQHKSAPLHAKDAKPASTKSTKKSKTIISMDKSLNLNPSGEISAVDFANGKAPATVIQKCVVAVYYLRDMVKLEKVGVSGVFTFFKHLSWPVPNDLKNTLQQAGTAGYLDTANSEDIKLTHHGDNLVEHKLPPKAETKKK